MYSLSKFKFPKFCKWGVRQLQYSLYEADPEDMSTVDLFNFFVHFYKILSEKTELFNIPINAICPKQKLVKIKIQEQVDRLYYEREGLPEGAPEIARCQLEIVENYLLFLYNIGLIMEINGDAPPEIDTVEFYKLKNKFWTKVLSVKKNHENKNNKNPTFDFETVFDMLGIRFQVDGETCHIIIHKDYIRMPVALQSLSHEVSKDKKNGLYRFCRLDKSQDKIKFSFEDVIDRFPVPSRPHLREIKSMLDTQPGARVQVKCQFQLGSIYEPQIHFMLGNNPLYVIYSTGNGDSVVTLRHYLRWILSPEESRRFFENVENCESGIADITYNRLRRCRLSACSFDDGKWCKMNYRSELIRGDEHFYTCGVETWAVSGIGDDDYAIIKEYIRAILRVC